MAGRNKDQKDKENIQKSLSRTKRPGVAAESSVIEEDPDGARNDTIKAFWVTRAIAEERGRAEVLRTTLVEFIVYLFFLIAITIYITGIRHHAEYYLTKGLKLQFASKEFLGLNDKPIKLEDVTSAGDFWFYLENHLIASLFWESTYLTNTLDKNIDENAMNILRENIVLGVPRIRQVKVTNESCQVHEYFRRLFVECYDVFSPTAEDTDSFEPTAGSATDRIDTAWTYSNADKTKSSSYSGHISKYTGGGFYVDLKRDKNKSRDIIAYLKDNLWITRGTRAVFVDFSVYNVNLNLFCVCKLVFEFPSTGGVVTTPDFQSLRLIRFQHKYDYFVLACELISYAFVLYYFCEELVEVVYFKHLYLTKFWNYVDQTIILCSIAGAVFSLLKFLNIRKAILLILDHKHDYGNLEAVGSLHIHSNNLFAVILFFIYVKIFKFMNFNRTMGQLNNTLKKCAMDILAFSIMFFIIFFAFAELGYLLFGSQVENFSSFGKAMFTLLRTILGDFEYDEIEKANRILAPIYFLSYIFLVFFVLLNMFLAIINDTYADVKTEIAIAPDEMQLSEYVVKMIRFLLNKLGCKVKEAAGPDIRTELNATIWQIREALKKCGFSDLEIEMFFARYNIDPLAEVQTQDVEELLTELEEVLRQGEKELTGFVHINDFSEQQKRLERLDRTIASLMEQVKALLVKLDQMDSVRKVKPK